MTRNVSHKGDVTPANMFDRLAGPVLALLSLVAYLLTTSACASVGPFDHSARLIAQHTGISPFPSTANPLWGFAARVIAAVPVGSLALRLNLFSAACGALAVWLMYSTVSGIILPIPLSRSLTIARARNAARLSGVAAAVFLAFSVPFWIASNRAHVASFDMLLLLGVTRIFLAYLRREKDDRIGLVFAFLYGLCTTESATFIVLFPVYAYLLINHALDNRRLKKVYALKLLLVFIAGLFPYLLSAARIYRHPLFELSGLGNYARVVGHLLGQQCHQITKSLPSVGWLTVVIVSALPAIICIALAKSALTGRSRLKFAPLTRKLHWEYSVLHLTITAMAVIVLFNLKPAPWALLGAQYFLVTPYLLTAWVYGYLVAYWYLLPASTRSGRPGARERPLPTAIGLIMVVAAILALCTASILNYKRATAAPSRYANEHVEAILDDLDGRTWLISDGVFDHHLMIQAKERGLDLTILDLAQSYDHSYMAYIGSLFDNPRLKALATLGPEVFINEWLSSDSNAVSTVAILTVPSLWISAGLQAVPHRTLFLGSRDASSLDSSSLLREHTQYWAKHTERVAMLAKYDHLQGLANYLSRHASLIANNLGVLMQENGHAREAHVAYETARNLDTRNYSALINISSLGSTPNAPEEIRDSGREATRELTIQQASIPPPWQLAAAYGDVLMPKAYEAMGWRWTLTGNHDLSAFALQKAIELDPSRSDQAKRLLAQLDVERGLDQQAEALYKEILEDNPADHGVILALARLAARSGDLDAAKSHLRAAKEAGADDSAVAMELAIAISLTEGPEQAVVILKQLVKDRPNMKAAWSMLADLAVEAEDKATVQKCMLYFEKLGKDSFPVVIAMAKVEASRGNISRARANYTRALDMRPSSVPILEALLDLDIRDKNMQRALVEIRNLLRIDPNNAAANHILGTIQFARGEHQGAIDSLERSILRNRTPQALNDLAWILARTGQEEEALPYVESAIDLAPDLASAWDTLGTIRMAMGNFAEAERSLEEAARLDPDHPVIAEHIAELRRKLSAR